MLVLFAVIFGGIVTGRLLQSRRLAFVSRLIAVIIWALLFLLDWKSVPIPPSWAAWRRWGVPPS